MTLLFAVATFKDEHDDAAWRYVVRISVNVVTR